MEATENQNKEKEIQPLTPAPGTKLSASELVGAENVQQELEQALQEFACLAIVDDYNDGRILLVSGTGLTDASK